MKKIVGASRRCVMLFGLLLSCLTAVHAAVAPLMELCQVSPSTGYVQGLSTLGSAENKNFISNVAFVVTSAGVVVVDALGSSALATRVVAERKTVTPLPITHVLVTHYHADHVCGLQVFKALGAKTFAHRAAMLYLNRVTARLRLESSREEQSLWIENKTHLVSADEWLDCGNESVIGEVLFQAKHMGPAHTLEGLVFYMLSEKCVVCWRPDVQEPHGHLQHLFAASTRG